MNFPKDADVQAKAAHIIWETSRADEKTISAAGANIVAAALAEAGLIGSVASLYEARVEARRLQTLADKYEDERNAARAELEKVKAEKDEYRQEEESVREVSAKYLRTLARAEAKLMELDDENTNLKNRLLVRYRELDEANSRAHDAEVELARAEADREHWKEAAELAATALVNEKGHHENTRKAWRADEADIRAELAEARGEIQQRAILQRASDALGDSLRARAKKAEAERESLRRQVAAVAKQAHDAERRGAVAALRDLATELDWVQPDKCPCDHPEDCCGSEASCAAMQPITKVIGATNLRARADRIEGDLRGNDGLTDEERRGLLTSFHKGIGAKHD